MSTLLTAAEQSSRLMARFSQQLSAADVKHARSLPLMAATSLILVGTDEASSKDLLAPNLDAVRACLRSRFAALESLVRAKRTVSP